MATRVTMGMRPSLALAMAVVVSLVLLFPEMAISQTPGASTSPPAMVASTNTSANTTAPSTPAPPPAVQCRYKFNGTDTIELSQLEGGRGYPELGVLFPVNANRPVTVANSGNCSFINDATGELDSHCNNQFYMCENRLCSQAFQPMPKEKTIYNYLIRHVRLNISQVFANNVNELQNGRADFCVEFRTANTVRVPSPPPPPPPPPASASAPASKPPASGP
ncbi:hypothetical protein CBR_g2870 [Chara braunii]|uniref:Pherophorin domain-containing protein n=1 Tax=Chara braunii TaxID=69332 RepID=A0A388KE95_CHABU|nr:hypothetical protein CBR_g2870 [Chara braunii]|eukprot:GBG68326.1 hypothetical protein CBR_g2870 [Chara braunii]